VGVASVPLAGLAGGVPVEGAWRLVNPVTRQPAGRLVLGLGWHNPLALANPGGPPPKGEAGGHWQGARGGEGRRKGRPARVGRGSPPLPNAPPNRASSRAAPPRVPISSEPQEGGPPPHWPLAAVSVGAGGAGLGLGGGPEQRPAGGLGLQVGRRRGGEEPPRRWRSCWGAGRPAGWVCAQREWRRGWGPARPSLARRPRRTRRRSRVD
jgi:hypothetical protein